METKEREHQEEIDLFEIFQSLWKQRYIVVGLPLLAMIIASIISFISPKVYRAEYVLHLPVFLTSQEYADIFNKNILSKRNLQIIFPKNHKLVKAVKIEPIKDSKDKVKLTLETTDPKSFSVLLSEFLAYNESNPELNKILEQEREILKRKIEELSKAIEESKNIEQRLKESIISGKLTIIGFNPTDVSKKIIDMEIERLRASYDLENLKIIKPLNEFVYQEPVKPRILLNLLVAGFLGLTLGVFAALVIEAYRKRKEV